jgi:MGT family glycosyltransferase
LAKFVGHCISKVTTLATSGVRRRASEVRRAYNLPLLSTGVNEFSGTMPLYLVPSTPELDYDRDDLPGSVHYVGSCLWDEPALPPVPDSARGNGTSRGSILVAEGTLFAPDPLLLQVAAKALADCGSEVVLLAGKGRDIEQLRLGKFASNIRIEPWVPLSTVLPAASMVVCNGNSEIVLASLSQGLPMVIVPSMVDQEEMSWRVSDSGAGVRLPIRRCSPERLREAVTLVKSDQRFRKNAESLGFNLAQRGGAKRAAELLEGLLSG